MSRIGNQPIMLPAGVEVKIHAEAVTVKGPKGEMQSPLFAGIRAMLEGNTVVLDCEDLENKTMKANYGLARALLANVVTGVSRGFERVLELRGVGYRAQVQGRKLSLSLGFSHTVDYPIPEGIEIGVDQNRIVIRGSDKQRAGQVAAEIRAFRPPEPYKGKGIRYIDEVVRMKEGKKA